MRFLETDEDTYAKPLDADSVKEMKSHFYCEIGCGGGGYIYVLDTKTNTLYSSGTAHNAEQADNGRYIIDTEKIDKERAEEIKELVA